MPYARKLRASALVFALVALCSAAFANETTRVGPVTERPLPRFATVDAEPARIRRGPSFDHGVRWVLNRRNLPVRIIGEYDRWRRVQFHDGETGWIFFALLSGRDYAIFPAGEGALHAHPDAAAAVTARVPPIHPLALERCSAGWCLLEGDGARGWAPQSALWGADDLPSGG